MNWVKAERYDKFFAGRDILRDYKVIARDALNEVLNNSYERESSMYYWVARAAEHGCAEAWGELGDAFQGLYADINVFSGPDEEDIEEVPLIVDSRMALVFDLMGEDGNDRVSLENLYKIFQGKYDEIPRDFERAFDCLIRLQREDLKRIKEHPDEAHWALNHHGEYLLRELVEEQREEHKWVDWEYSYVLGICYENGWILEKDLKKSAEYYAKALSMGYKKAKKDLERIAAL